ncbi:MAG TPA: hypothetical protein DDX84_02870 [Nitrospiraceae bacterium]|nr:MAG: hypothetical protein A2035_01860 [Nitrospirae bacterium GWA2_42_11]OGW57228.1 MAG: hypothetical protein A3D21_04670 [Nitrospirae bacterium RIFCSPHIGHO2_02_FULL_42_12]HBI23156.1 hypothetical protein [Nitrospiraceae bacterium]
MQVLNIFFLLTTFILSLFSAAQAVDFDARDSRVDLPILMVPNNAVTPHMSADKNGHIYVTWSDNKGGSPSIYTNTFFPGRGWLPDSIPITTGYPRPQGSEIGNAISPQVCSDNSGHVYVVWVDDRAVKAKTGKRDIYLRYSKDYGLTWYHDFIDERIDSDNPAIGDSINPQITCNEDGNVYVVWQDDRNNAGIYEVYFRSLQIRFAKPADYIQYYQYPEVKLNTGVTAGRYNAIYSMISTDRNGHVYVVWEDKRNVPEEDIYPGIYFNVSKDHGSTWLQTATRIDSAPIGFYDSRLPVISSDSNGYVYAAWTDNAGRPTRGDEFAGDGTLDVYFNRSVDYGVTWDKEDKRIDTPAQRVDVRHAAIGSNDKGVVCIVWSSNFDDSSSGNKDHFNIYFNHSENRGSTFLDSKSNIRLDTGVQPEKTSALAPLVQVDNIGNVYAVWVDKRESTYDIFFNFSIEKGQKDTWQDSDIRLDYPNPPGDSINHRMTIDNTGNVYVVWQDDRSALAEGDYNNIYFISGFLDIERLLISGQRVGEACFIATAVYGNPFDPRVKLLREFRDRHLMSNRFGKWFVSLYYRFSPPAADFISENSYLKAPLRIALLPVVGIAALAMHTTNIQKVMLILLILCVLTTAWAFWQRLH